MKKREVLPEILIIINRRINLISKFELLHEVKSDDDLYIIYNNIIYINNRKYIHRKID